MSILSHDKNAFRTNLLTTKRRDLVNFEVEERDLDKRVAAYSTQVSMAKTRISYGNLKPADVLAHLNAVCTDKLTGCNYEDTDPLTIASEMYVNAVTIPVSGHLTLNPKGVFAQGNGSAFVDCVVKTAPYGTQVSLSSKEPFPSYLATPAIENSAMYPTHVSREFMPREHVSKKKLTLTRRKWGSVRQNRGTKSTPTQKSRDRRTLWARRHFAP